jgi:hypothetical protein
MKSQARLRLRQVGKHHLTRDNVMTGRAWARTIGDGTIGRTLIRAFEYNCVPKHYDTGIQAPCYTMNYISGKTTWHPPPLPVHTGADGMSLLKSVAWN